MCGVGEVDEGLESLQCSRVCLVHGSVGMAKMGDLDGQADGF